MGLEAAAGPNLRKMIEKLTKMNSKLADLMVQLAKLEGLGIGITTKYEDNYPSLLKMKLKKIVIKA